MFEFKHPKYYKNLRAAARAAQLSIRPPARNTDQAISEATGTPTQQSVRHDPDKLDQAISGKNSTECKTRSPGPGLKQQASSSKQKVTSDKLQAKPEPSSGS